MRCSIHLTILVLFVAISRCTCVLLLFLGVFELSASCGFAGLQDCRLRQAADFLACGTLLLLWKRQRSVGGFLCIVHWGRDPCVVCRRPQIDVVYAGSDSTQVSFNATRVSRGPRVSAFGLSHSRQTSRFVPASPATSKRIPTVKSPCHQPPSLTPPIPHSPTPPFLSTCKPCPLSV